MKAFLILAGIVMIGSVGEAQVRAPALTSALHLASSGLSSTPANSHSRKSSISDDGRYIAFESAASNLVSGDTNGLSDVFVYDTQSNTTVRASVATAGTQANGKSSKPAISGDGRYVAFTSLASNLVASDTNVCGDIFVRDLQSNTTVRASVGVSAVEADGCSDVASISDNGRYVGFRSDATNLIGSSDTNALSDFFVRDLTSATTIRVSVSTAGTEGDDVVGDGVISGDGGFFVFASKATNMVASDTNGCIDVFVRNIGSSTTELISKSTAGALGNRPSESVDISSDGRYVVFNSRASNLTSGDVNGYKDVYLRDRTNSTTEMISRDNLENQVRFDSVNPVVSNDGRFVLYESYSPDYVTGDNNTAVDVVLKDRSSRHSTVVSASASGVIGNKTSRDAAMSGDGTALAFVSLASNLLTGDTNGSLDVYYRANQLIGQVVNVTPEAVLAESGTANGFKFERFGSTASALDVNYTVSGTATSGTDYTALSGTITIAASASTAFLPVSVTSDAIVETDETIVVSISPDSNYMAGALRDATNSIADDDVFVVTVAATDNVASEDGTNDGQFTVTRAGGTLGDLYVNVVVGGSATLGTDYTGVSTPVLIPAGHVSSVVPVIGIPDTIEEGDEGVELVIAVGASYTVGSPSGATVTIKDDDSQVVNVVTIDAIAHEDDPANTAVFRISRNGSTTAALIVKYVMRGTAQNGLDYTALSGSATIAASQPYVDVVVIATSDSIDEGVETVQLELLDAEFYKLGTSRSSVALIEETHSLPIVRVEATDAVASEDGTNTGEFTVSRTGSTASSLVVNFVLGGTARYSDDYTSSATSSVTIASGQSTATVTITGNDDALVEDIESVVLALQSNSNYVIEPVLGKATVLISDDEVPSLYVRTPIRRTLEGSEAGEIRIVRSGDLSSSLTVNFSLSGTGTSGADYTSPGTSATIAAGEAEKILNIHAHVDGLVEGPEHVLLTLASGSGYTVSPYSQGRVEIIDTSYSLMRDIFSVVPNGDIRDVSVSDDGRYVVFSSTASNLVAGDYNNSSDIFISDLSNSTIARILAIHGQEPNGPSSEAKISNDGRFVVFSTEASNFFDYDVNKKRDVILYNLSTGVSAVLSLGSFGIAVGGDSFQPSISSTGDYIAFASDATNLVPGDTNGKADIFVFSRNSGSITRANFSTAHGQFTHSSRRPAISQNGNWVAFETAEQIDGDSDLFFDIVVKNSTTDELTRISKPISGTANDGDSTYPAISGDGSIVNYISLAQKLVSSDVNGVQDVFSTDSGSVLTRLVSVKPNGVGADMPSRMPSISRSGAFGTFVSGARNLSSNFNCTNTAMVKDLVSGLVMPIAYQTSSLCQPPLSESTISGDGRWIVSVVVSNIGPRDILISSNPLYR